MGKSPVPSPEWTEMRHLHKFFAPSKRAKSRIGDEQEDGESSFRLERRAPFSLEGKRGKDSKKTGDCPNSRKKGKQKKEGKNIGLKERRKPKDKREDRSRSNEQKKDGKEVHRSPYIHPDGTFDGEQNKSVKHVLKPGVKAKKKTTPSFKGGGGSKRLPGSI